MEVPRLMPNWSEVERQAPELGARVRGRFEAHGLGMLATLRKDGAPRISGIEVLFDSGELWLGMMPDSLKAKDLIRDPRFALHSATTDKQVAEGDAKIAGLAVPVEDESTIEGFRLAVAARTGYPPPPGPMRLFTLDVAELSILKPGGPDFLNLDAWHAGRGETHTELR